MKTIVSFFAVLPFVLSASFAIESAVGQTGQYVATGRGAASAGSPQVQANSATYRSPQTIASQASLSGKIVGYRAPDWQTLHTASKAEAEQTVATLKRIGCEVEANNHGDHVDVKFRCPEWRSMKVKTHALQAQWSNWCENQGLETVVVNPAPNSKRPTVEFQMVQPRTVHLHDQNAAQKILNTLTLVGCQISTNDHGDHTDATFSCAQWTTIELATEDSAHAWQKWLKESGFETKHAHVHEEAVGNNAGGSNAGGNNASGNNAMGNNAVQGSTGYGSASR